MARLKNYKGSVEVMSGLRSKNDRGFPLVQANDVQVDENGTRLDEVLENIAGGGGAGGATIYEETVTVTEKYGYTTPADLGVALSLTLGETYVVELNGKSYKCVYGVTSDGSYQYLGNQKLLLNEYPDTGEPFCLALASHTTYLKTNAVGVYTLKIKEAASGGIAELAEQVATNTSAIEYLEQRVEGNEESIRDLYKNTIHTFNSVEEMNAANLPDGTIALVPSSGESGGGGGGLPVVELSTTFTPNAFYTEEESALLNAAAEKKCPIIISCAVSIGDLTIPETRAVWNYANGGGHIFYTQYGTSLLQIGCIENRTWIAAIDS